MRTVLHINEDEYSYFSSTRFAGHMEGFYCNISRQYIIREKYYTISDEIIRKAQTELFATYSIFLNFYIYINIYLGSFYRIVREIVGIACFFSILLSLIFLLDHFLMTFCINKRKRLFIAGPEIFSAIFAMTLYTHSVHS